VTSDRPTGGEPQETAGPRPADVADRPGDDETPGVSDWYEEGGAVGSEGPNAAGGSHRGGSADAAPPPEVGTEGEAAESSPAQQLAERTLDLQRLQAEYVNYKRRVDRDRDLVRENATFSVLVSLLPVLDDIDRAREHGELEGGFKAVAESLERVVAGLGLTKYGEKGDAFDPNVHEALMHGHSPDVTTTSVEHVAQAGYRIGPRVVRAAKVTVLDPE
jgi:molecular chaperone GrpE